MNVRKHLTTTLKKHSGRNSSGIVTVHHQGGGVKQRLRTIDWKRNKHGISAVVEGIEYDPTRTSRIALLKYTDGERRYILAPDGLKIGDTVMSGKDAEVKLGNFISIERIPLGTPIHNLELTPGKGSQIVRVAGSQAIILSKENEFADVRLPSGEIRKILLACCAAIGQVSNIDWKNTVVGKAGKSRWLGKRPTVRGVAQNPNSHPHGGGEGRSGIGMPSPKTPWGKLARGKKTRKKGRYSDGLIIKGSK